MWRFTPIDLLSRDIDQVNCRNLREGTIVIGAMPSGIFHKSSTTSSLIRDRLQPYFKTWVAERLSIHSSGEVGRCGMGVQKTYKLRPGSGPAASFFLREISIGVKG